jgi:hypothetical protein
LTEGYRNLERDADAPPDRLAAHTAIIGVSLRLFSEGHADAIAFSTFPA